MTLRATVLRVVGNFLMLVCHVGNRVLVTAKAGVGRGTARMTGDTGDDRILAMGQREGVREVGGLPGGGGVARGAVDARFTSVRILAAMA